MAEVSPAALNAISGYRTVFDFFAGLGTEDLDTLTRVILGVAGAAALLLFALLALRELPRPRLARHPVTLAADERGAVELEPRALERAAETAAAASASVTSAAGRADDGRVAVEVVVQRPDLAADVLGEVRTRVREALERHDLPVLPVDVTLTGIDQSTGRDLA